MTPYALFYHISHVDLAAEVARSKNTNTPDAATCMKVHHLSFKLYCLLLCGLSTIVCKLQQLIVNLA